ncbi:hypothetical protein BO99DRAFT_404371 [Aspergillus violaceofuscus CBS 115571]|uniref:Uncharacterized protein n=1 Tax=Aspergillus violaceofuscus (strain CBS 115571) TaxID=1450538 RepID=A0A2V5H0K1_ASPV1|nr:hypothetical protein BO99DRAFT_404371 [Aspergillus violaceofuscus CBS 115571]
MPLPPRAIANPPATPLPGGRQSPVQTLLVLLLGKFGGLGTCFLHRLVVFRIRSCYGGWDGLGCCEGVQKDGSSPSGTELVRGR